MNILGVSAFYHDSSACLLRDGKIAAAVQEERFTRKKNDSAFPLHSIRYALDLAQLKAQDLDAIIFYDKPMLTFERLLETYLHESPRGFLSFLNAMPIWLSQKLNLKGHLRKEFKKHFGLKKASIFFSSHHLSHAASAFFPSPFGDAAVLCMDGVGEWATTSAWVGEKNSLTPLWEIQFPHSLGLLYSTITAFCGFKVNSGEYKLMGLAPFGKPRFQQRIEDHLIDIKEDGTFRLAMEYFSFTHDLKMFNHCLEELFGVPARPFEGTYDPIYADIAASIQATTNKIVLRLARTLRQETGKENLCLAGGVALNCVANGLIVQEKIFKNIWVQPAAGDAGGSLGAALAYYYLHQKHERRIIFPDQMQGAFLGPEFADQEIDEVLKTLEISARKLSPSELLEQSATLLSEQNILGWFQGRMEYGPRALGHRSILGDARNPDMKSTMNLKIKFREGFRPFAPVVLEEHREEYFSNADSYMLTTAVSLQGEKLPAITHVDGSARVQAVRAEQNPFFHQLLGEFKKRTGCPVLINTSFNVRGEPIVCTPREAIDCFVHTDIDALAIGSFLLLKKDVLHLKKSTHRKKFELD